ncbi:PP0621 family protein [Ramlibacter tataouinensis]|uniref:PP0621 family protein n=1 Tax=Ramlibacter tataouinensis TaxID=94132 RepID=UPI0022F3EA17|nr:PP0621 family protein [Ramlibacter tataouinensis]WBY03739.1 PP0621 family protein [Ramlibacter tataouinensis]
MKYLLVLAVLAIAYLLWRGARTRAIGRQSKGPAALPQDMVRCPVCSLHLPRPDAVPGASGRLYCSAEHRRAGGN